MLADDEEREERQLRMDLMTVNIEKMRFDMATQQTQLAWETRKWAVSLFLALAAAVGAGVGVGNLIWAHQKPVPVPAAVAPPQIVFQPGSIVVQQPAAAVPPKP